MADVFVSYKAEDRRRVRPLVEALEADGYSIWWDEQIGGGAAWRHTIEAELNSAKCVLVLWSKRSVAPEGEFVQDEATRAKQRRVYVPVTIDKVHLPLGFGESQAIPLTGWKGDRSDARYQAVLGAVRRIGGEPRGAAATRHLPRAAASRRAVLGGGALAVAGIAGVGAWTFLKPDPASDRSIAVLPFANLSGDPAQAYFSDGIAEELRSALARLAGLKVVGRTSSEAVRNDDGQTAAQKLGVSNILTGSVRQSPSTIRVYAQLIDGHTGLERWSETYDRTPGDAIKIQADIAENVVRALSAALGRAAGAALRIGGTDNAMAQNLLLQSGEAMDEQTRAGTERAIRLIDEALRLDPAYADAYARKAIYITSFGELFATGSAELAHTRAQAFQAARKAAALEPDSPRAHFALANLYSSRLEIGRAALEYRRAMQLAPGDATILRPYGFFLTRAVSPSEGLRLADKVIELDPLNSSSYVSRAAALYSARRYADAVQLAQETERRSTDLFDEPALLGFCFLMLDKPSEASQHFAQLPPDGWERLKGEAVLLARARDRAGAERKLHQMHQLFGDSMSYEYAGIYAQLGEKDRAFRALERAWSIRDPGLISVRVDPFIDPLRGDPRLDSIIKRMHFPVA